MKNWRKGFQALMLVLVIGVLNIWNLQAYGAASYGPGSKMTGAEKDHSTGTIPVDGSYLGGAKLTLLSNQSDSQMLSAILETKNGSLIVIDGGTEADASYLLQKIQEKGGHVSAWLITHPHSDHVGAITKLLNDGAPITIDGIYYNLTSIEWYQTYESYRADMVAQFAGALGRVSPEKLHGNVKSGDQIQVDDVTITVLNSPYLIETNSINNSSVAYSLEVNGKHIVFLGDMGEEAGQRLMQEYQGRTIECDIVQMAHHGQFGVSRDVYEALSPDICLWPTPGWLWNNDIGKGYNSGPWTTLITRSWMDQIGVKANYAIKDGDQVIQ